MEAAPLQGRVVVVTGAAGRLGGHLARAFAGRGATLAAVVRTEADARRIPFPAGGDGWAFLADTADDAAVRLVFEQIQDQFGRIDVLLHPVGAWQATPLRETTVEAWDGLLRTNLTSTFLCFREAARYMGPGGRLVAFAAAQGADRAPAAQAAYAAAKAGVVRLVEATAAELAPEGITAHAIAPSTILYDDDDTPGVPVAALVDLALYLCTPAAAALTGATLRAYGEAP